MTHIPGNPATVTLIRAGEGEVRNDAPVASAPFAMQMLLTGNLTGEMTAMRATFSAGSVTRWHSHPLGQLLVALAGEGRAQVAGQPVMHLGPGDAIWFPPDNRHWHGAAAGSAFTYLSVQQIEDGTHVHWYEPVADLAAAG